MHLGVHRGPDLGCYRWRGRVRPRRARPRCTQPICASLLEREDRDPEAPLFPIGSTDRLRMAISRACRDAGVPTFSPHDLRHRRISLLHHEGVHGRRSELASGSEASRRRPRRTPMCLWTIGRSIAQSYSSASARCTPRSTPRRAKPPCLQERSRPAAPILAHVVERSSLNYVGQERRKPTNRHRRHPYVDTLGSRRNRPRPVRPSRREPRGGQPVTVEPVPEDDCAGTTSYSATIASSFSGYPSAR